MTEIHATTQQRLAELETAINVLLEFEKEKASFQGLADCTCMNHSREAEAAYEAGRCPHQRARKALAGEHSDQAGA